MGYWTIVIEGHGIHHNRQEPKDANRMAAAFVQDLRAAGHEVDHATFAQSGRDYIDDQSYLGSRDDIEKPKEA